MEAILETDNAEETQADVKPEEAGKEEASSEEQAKQEAETQEKLLDIDTLGLDESEERDRG